MTVNLTVEGRTRAPEVVEYTVNEDITPLALGDSSGGVGNITLSVRTERRGGFRNRTAGAIDADMALSDTEDIEFSAFKGRGRTRGKIVNIDEGPVSSRITADTMLTRLNVTKTAEPVFGSRTQGTVSTTTVNPITNPSLELDTANYSVVLAGGAAAVSRLNTGMTAVAGTYHGRVTWSSAATGLGAGVAYTQTGLSGSKPFNLRWSLAASLAQTVRISYVWKDNAGATISTQIGGVYTLGGAAWQDVNENVVSPPGTASVVIQALSYSGVNWPTSSYLMFDALALLTSPGAYFDGSSANSAWSGTAHASTSSKTILSTVDYGYDATLGYAIRYYLSLCDISPADVVVESAIDGIRVAFPGWEGNVWTHFKALCAAYNIEAIVRDDKVVVSRPHTREIKFENEDSLSRNIDTANNNATIEVKNYNTRYLTGSVIYDNDDSRSVDAGEVIQTTFKVDHWLSSVNNPIPLTAVVANIPASGYYTVTDAAGLTVNPQWWTDNGGKIETAVDDWHNVTMQITAPTVTTAYTAPYKIGGIGSALVLTGAGIFLNPESVILYTGSPTGDNEQAPTIDNIFIASKDMAVDRGMHAAQRSGGPVITVSGVMSYLPDSKGQEFGYVSGTRFQYDFAYYRIRDARITSQSIEFNAESATTFGDLTAAHSITFDEFNITYAGYTFATFNTAFTGYSFDEFNGSTPVPTFDDFDKLYAGATFNDYAVTPLITKTSVIAEEDTY